MTEVVAEPGIAPTLGDEIRERRKRHGWTQRELAARLVVRREQVAIWEGGRLVGGRYWPILEDVLRIRVDPQRPAGWVDADEDDAARAKGATIVNVVVVVATPSKAREILRGLGARANAVDLADADDVIARLGIAPT